MTDDEVAAYHEAAHAVLASAGDWIRLVEPVTLKGHGYGVAGIAMDREKIESRLEASCDFDLDAPRKELIRAFIAGAVVERVLVARGQAGHSEDDILSAAADDYKLARGQLAKLDPPQIEHLAYYESEVRELIERPIVWCMIEAVARFLLEHRELAHDDLPAMLEEICEECEREQSNGE